ncbi:Lrp/AsnC family transcriptional regulator [Nocardia sp. NPDC003482]
MDVEDLRLLRALQLAPRAGFATLAGILGAHERTVARRYRRLRRAGVVRIVGMVNPLAVGHQLWQVRLRCRPDAAQGLATALAARADIAWMGVSAPGSEVSFSVRSLSARQRDLLLTRLLPRSAQVHDIEASVVLHVFLGLGSRGWSQLDPLLTPAEIARLTAEHPPAGEIVDIPAEPHDAALFDVLAADGRATTARLAEAAGISPGRAARRLDTLVRTRSLVLDVDLAHEALGYTTWAQLYCAVSPSRLHEVGETMARLPAVGFVAALSGRHNLIIAVCCRDLAELYEFSTRYAGAAEGIVTMEVVPFGRVVKQSGGLVADGRLVDPVGAEA